MALASSSPNTVVPATVVVPAGASTVTFAVRALLVSGPTYTTQIRADSGATTLAQTVTVAPGLVAIELPVSGLSGGTSYVRVVLSGPASQSEYVDIPVASSNSARKTWPATLSPRTDSALAGVYRTRVLTRDEPITLSATRGTRTVSVSTVLRAPGVASSVTLVRINQPYDEPYIHGLDGAPEYMAVLDRPAPPSTSLTWSAPNDGPGTYLPVLSTTAVSEGEVVATNSFRPPDVERSVHFSLRATVTGHPDVVGSVLDTVHPNVRSVTHPARIVGGQSFQAVISLAGPSEVDTELVINPRNGVLTVQPTVLIPAGSTQATVTVTSIPTAMDEFGGLMVHLNQTSVHHEVLINLDILASP